MKWFAVVCFLSGMTRALLLAILYLWASNWSDPVTVMVIAILPAP
jgi:hypothetical protein